MEFYQSLFQTTTGFFPLGNPSRGTKVFVLDDFSNPVPLGVKGTLHISSDSIGISKSLKRSKTKEDNLGI
ncbi:n-(5-amino-5-carboxypentanoyl)-l-cysteinyl-d-valine synthase [Anaeramoeba ignava]|uniref:N-(5-amino-5-carboxypentanoyl)-l-cysteinyl-d-valine synthase n=1 Tax=Anaeramoeba ignava TaxID=1746090 RepID=A0A9Q0LRR1_ANAIG|nr:n-(5-amino-5-carboxypentanoyl)-l-cysteinyl-d-valine synthase [Anaeramoeba ignava]